MAASKNMEKPRKAIQNFTDLDVYQNSYNACIRVYKELLPRLPKEEKFDLCDQLSISTKAIPRLIAEGYGKKHQKLGFQKYLDDAMAECSETIVGISQCRDIYGIDTKLCNELIKVYDMTARQLFRLAGKWDQFTLRYRSKKTGGQTQNETNNT